MIELSNLAIEIRRAYFRRYNQRRSAIMGKVSKNEIDRRFWQKKADLVCQALNTGGDPDAVLSKLGLTMADLHGLSEKSVHA